MHYFLSVREVYNHDGDDEGHYEDNERRFFMFCLVNFFMLSFDYIVYMQKWGVQIIFFLHKVMKKALMFN